jgi:hypothetical protein
LCPELKRNQHESNEKQAAGLREIQYTLSLFLLVFGSLPWESRLVGISESVDGKHIPVFPWQ